jgi:type I restriction enzyme, S subunit
MHEPSLVRLDSLAALVNEKVNTAKDPSTPYVGLEHLPSGGSLLLGTAESAQSISTNNAFRAGDVLFGKLRPRLRKSVRAPFAGYCSTDILVLRPAADVDPIFAGFVLQSDAVFAEAIRTEEGTKMPRCSWSTLKHLRVYCPKPSQQQRIAQILSTVDEAIEQTEALIAKTQQTKAGLMQDLFTRGVNADGQLRPPREEAPHFYKKSSLGWIPNEWDLKACSEICLSVIDCKNRTPPATEDGHPVIRTPNVRDGEFVWADLAFTDPVSYVEWTARGRPVAGDVVITREAPVGEVCMIPKDLEAPCLGQRMMLYRPDPNQVLGSFLVQVLQSTRVQKHLDVISGGSTVGHVRVGDIRTLRVPWAPMHEQEAIAPRLDGVREQLTNLRAEALMLQQIKAGLMHDLLTGRISVVVERAPGPKDVAANV